jgi:hypothetical protein
MLIFKFKHYFSDINEVKKEEKIEIDYEEEGGISFVVYPQTCKH